MLVCQGAEDEGSGQAEVVRNVLCHFHGPLLGRWDRLGPEDVQAGRKFQLESGSSVSSLLKWVFRKLVLADSGQGRCCCLWLQSWLRLQLSVVTMAMRLEAVQGKLAVMVSLGVVRR